MTKDTATPKNPKEEIGDVVSLIGDPAVALTDSVGCRVGRTLRK